MKILIVGILLVGLSASADVWIKDLHGSDSVKKAADRIDRLFGDNQISTGTVSIVAVQTDGVDVDSNPSLKTLGETAFKKFFQENVTEDLPRDTKLKSKISEVSPSQIWAIAKIIAEGFAFNLSNDDNIKTPYGQLRSVLKQLGKDAELKLVVTSASLKDSSSEEMRKVTTATFISKKDGVAVSVFVIEGTI